MLTRWGPRRAISRRCVNWRCGSGGFFAGLCGGVGHLADGRSTMRRRRNAAIRRHDTTRYRRGPKRRVGTLEQWTSRGPNQSIEDAQTVHVWSCRYRIARRPDDAGSRKQLAPRVKRIPLRSRRQKRRERTGASRRSQRARGTAIRRQTSAGHGSVSAKSSPRSSRPIVGFSPSHPIRSAILPTYCGATSGRARRRATPAKIVAQSKAS